MASLLLPSGAVTQPFGCTGVSLEPAYGGCPHFHMGIDYAVPTGTPVRAPAAGVVTQAGWNGGYGNSITVRLANGMTVLQGHMASVAARVGQVVSAGEQLGLSDSTGASTGPHIHFEVRDAGGSPVDPASLGASGTGDPGATGGVIGGVNGGGIAQGAVDAVQGIGNALGAVSSFLGALTQPDTWMRVALVVGGIGLVAFGAWYLVSVPGDGE